MRRHVVLVGLPGVGKSTVGVLMARELGAPFADLDPDIEAAAGLAIPAIFAELGEPRFRALEAEAMARRLAGPPAVLAPGGGWAAQPGQLEAVLPVALVLYLEALPETAAGRAVGGERPLLTGPDRVARMRELLGNREPFYRMAHRRIATDLRPPEEIAAEAAALARRLAGW